MAKKTKLNEAFENPHFILTRYIPFSKMGGQEKLAEDSHFLAKKKFCLHATRREGVTSVKNTTIKMKQNKKGCVTTTPLIIKKGARTKGSINQESLQILLNYVMDPRTRNVIIQKQNSGGKSKLTSSFLRKNFKFVLFIMFKIREICAVPTDKLFVLFNDP